MYSMPEMPRIPEITERNALPEDQRPIFDAIAESRGRVGFPFSLLLHSPELAGRIAHLGAYLRFESSLEPVLREIAILTSARESDCNFEWAAHVRIGGQAGVREEVIEVIRERAPVDGLPEEEQIIIRYGRELLGKNRVSDETFQAAKERFGEPALVELTSLLGYYRMIACALNAFDAQPPGGASRLV
jgi:4-carboxymuconolactone decarboxylase